MKTQESSPLISVVVLSCNQTDVTCDFLESARALTYPNYEILICDMGSDVPAAAIIDGRQFPHVKVLRSETNLGCAGGRNWGVRQAKGDFVFLVDNDTTVTPNLLENLVQPLLNDESIAVVCPKIRFFHQPNVIQYAGFNPINPFTGRNSAIGSYEEDRGQHDVGRYTFSSHGCASMIRKSVFSKAGYFPEKFFFYYEEMDWSARVHNAGYNVYYQPQALIFHKQSMTLGLRSPKKLYYLTRNRILYMRRNTNLPRFVVFATFFAFFSVPKGLVTYGIKGQFRHLGSFLKGIVWNLGTSKQSIV